MDCYSTVRFVKLLDNDFSIGQWVHDILALLRFGPMMRVSLGFSFIASKNFHGQVTTADEPEYMYMYCPREAASFENQFESREQALKWSEKLKPMTNAHEIMELCFLFTDFGQFFRESGWRPKRPIAAQLWISK